MIKYLYYLIIVFFIVWLTQSVFSTSSILINLNLVLVFLVFITIIFGFNLGFVFAVYAGFLMNFYSYLPFGTLIAIYVAVITSVNFLYKNVFINFSLYTSVILISLATVFYSLVVYLFNLFYYFVGLTTVYLPLNQLYFFAFAWQLGGNLILMILIFILAQFTIKRLNLVFLFKK